jgi:hypothetical protein
VPVTVSRQIGSRAAIRSAQLQQGDIVVTQGSYELRARSLLGASTRL